MKGIESNAIFPCYLENCQKVYVFVTLNHKIIKIKAIKYKIFNDIPIAFVCNYIYNHLNHLKSAQIAYEKYINSMSFYK